jgi:hypothetical protein
MQMINSKCIHKVLIVFIFIALLAGCGTEDSQSEQVPPLPKIAKTISGQTYILDTNGLGLLSVSFSFPGGSEASITYSSSMDESQVIWDWFLVGLDDIERYSTGSDGTPWGTKGWWETDETFVTHIYPENSEWGRVEYIFEGEQITMELSPNASGVREIIGRLEE